ncbi:MAG TPA: hypothetical protein VMY59_01530 [Candidatus Thermoplasmatota archaeon]|nr:hypothetical protein [Candidatus Thermoplasmatota archaeon]
MKSKCLAVGIILLFVGITINPITGSVNQSDDCYPIFKGTPGRNGWYISPLIVTFVYDSINVTDIQSWLNESWIPYDGPFNITEQGELPLFKWRYHDKRIGSEWINAQCYCPLIPDFDKPFLTVSIQRKGFFFWKKYIITANAQDNLSGMDYVECYFNGQLLGNISGAGPLYKWTLKPVPRRQTLTFKVVAYDCAGNSNGDEIIKPKYLLK